MENMRRVVSVNIYRPLQGDYEIACKKIHETIKAAELKDNAEVFLVGEFNIDFNMRTAPDMKEFINTTGTWGLRHLITADTRIGLRDGQIKGSCIDNIFTNCDLVAESRVLDWNIGGHLVVIVRRKKWL